MSCEEKELTLCRRYPSDPRKYVRHRIMYSKTPAYLNTTIFDVFPLLVKELQEDRKIIMPAKKNWAQTSKKK